MSVLGGDNDQDERASGIDDGRFTTTEADRAVLWEGGVYQDVLIQRPAVRHRQRLQVARRSGVWQLLHV